MICVHFLLMRWEVRGQKFSLILSSITHELSLLLGPQYMGSLSRQLSFFPHPHSPVLWKDQGSHKAKEA